MMEKSLHIQIDHENSGLGLDGTEMVGNKEELKVPPRGS